MASLQTNSYQGRYIKFTVVEQSYSIDDNTSTLSWILEVLGGTHDYYSAYSIEAKINNEQVYGPVTKEYSTHQFPAARGSVSGTITIEHNQDGTADPVPISLKGSVYTNNPQTYTDTVTLTTIPRASAIGVSDANIGSSTNITINKASESFTTTLWYKADGENNWTKIVDKTSLQVYAWTVPTSFYALIPNSPNIVCEFKADTYSGNTLIGTKTTSAIFTATGSPIINSSTTVTDALTQSLTGDTNTVIIGITDLTITINATAQNSASIASYTIAGVTQSSNTRTISKVMTYDYGYNVTDSRGNSTSGGVVLPYINYVNLSLNPSIVRNTPTDNKVNISYNGNYFAGSFSSGHNNSLTVQYRYVEKGQSFDNVQWITLSPTIDSQNNSYSQTNYQISGIDYTKQYDFQIKSTDACQSVIVEGITVPKGKPIFNWEEDKFNVYGDIYQNETLLSNLFLSLSNGGTISGNVNVTGDLKKSGSNVALTSDIPTKTSDLTNDSGFIDGNEFIVATKTDNQTVSGNDTTVKYQLNSTLSSKGTKLTFNSTNNEITVGADVSYVEISAQLYVYTRGSNGMKHMYIYKNTSQITRYSHNFTADYETINIPPIIISVQEGDTITIQFRSVAGSTVLGGSSSNEGANYLTVKVIK